MFIKGKKTSEISKGVLLELYKLKKPNAVKYSRKNDILPFENETPLEFFSQKNDCSLFAFASHTKKRPNAITMGRMYDHHILDMFELSISQFKPMSAFKGVDKPSIGSKPCVILKGDEFESNEELKRFGNLFIDFFRGEEITQISLSGVDHVITCTAIGGMIHVRQYMIKLKKSGSKLPRVELEETGPSFDATIKRSKLAPKDLFKTALKKPKQLTAKKQKNISTNLFGDTLSTIHMEKQDLTQLDLARMKGLNKRKRPLSKGESEDDTPNKQQKLDDDNEDDNNDDSS